MVAAVSQGIGDYHANQYVRFDHQKDRQPSGWVASRGSLRHGNPLPAARGGLRSLRFDFEVIPFPTPPAASSGDCLSSSPVLM
jgi:hypothetical protein